MALLWAVPAVAVTIGLTLVLLRVRTLEDLSVDVMVAVHRTGELRHPLAETRAEMARSVPLVDRVWAHWADAPDDPAERPFDPDGRRPGS